MREIIMRAHCGHYGHMADAIVISGVEVPADLSAADFTFTNACIDLSDKTPTAGVTGISREGDALVLSVQPFRMGKDFEVTCARCPELSFAEADVDRVDTKGTDAFAYCEQDGAKYRLYTPAGQGKKPMILFFHGGGECGDDNEVQLTNCYGALSLAERFPDYYVLAPQCPAGASTMPADGKSFPKTPATSGGWQKDTQAKIRKAIDAMIDDGKVDPARIYVIGMSMGGAGTLRMIRDHGELFAAAAPICPTMMEETLAIVKAQKTLPIWISCAHMDFFETRHLQIIEGISYIQGAGNEDAHKTIYSPEELAAYGIGNTPGITRAEYLKENHHCWILTLENEYGILDWLVSHTK